MFPASALEFAQESLAAQASVTDFVRRHRADLSGLSFREATKHVRHLVMW